MNLKLFINFQLIRQLLFIKLLPNSIICSEHLGLSILGVNSFFLFMSILDLFNFIEEYILQDRFQITQILTY